MSLPFLFLAEDCSTCEEGYFDGCNLCTCDNGTATCTEKACAETEASYCTINGTAPTLDDICQGLALADGSSAVTVVIMVCVILAGLVICFLGWRLYQMFVAVAAFTCGFLPTWLGVALIIEKMGCSSDVAAYWIPIGVGVAVGIIAAIIAVKYIGLSMFITGCFMGIYVGVMINQICAQYIGNYASWAVWIWLVAMGILFGVLGIYLGQVYVMVCTAFGGAQSTMIGVFFIVVDLMDGTEWMCEDMQKPWAAWCFLGAAILLAIPGFAVQYKCFGDHEQTKYKQVGEMAV